MLFVVAFEENKNSTQSEWEQYESIPRTHQPEHITSIMTEIPPIGGQIKNIFWFFFLSKSICSAPNAGCGARKALGARENERELDTDSIYLWIRSEMKRIPCFRAFEMRE